MRVTERFTSFTRYRKPSICHPTTIITSVSALDRLPQPFSAISSTTEHCYHQTTQFPENSNSREQSVEAGDAAPP
jgi:hypothetical protein